MNIAIAPAIDIPLATLSIRLDQLLKPHRDVIGDNFHAYRNHCQRLLHYCMAMFQQEKIICLPDALLIAIAYHDLGIWHDKTFNYLAPSIMLANHYLHENKLNHLQPLVVKMIDYHHKLSPYTENPIIETFRKADWIDVSLGMLTFGLSKQHIKQIQHEFPNKGFHWCLIQLTVRQFLKQPMNPLPMIRK